MGRKLPTGDWKCFGRIRQGGRGNKVMQIHVLCPDLRLYGP